MSRLVFACALLALALSSNFFVSADHPGHDEGPKFCTSNVATCDLSGLNITCVSPKADSSCIKDVVDGKADLASAKADDIVKYEDDIKIVVGEQIKGLDKFIQYYGLAVVKKDTPFNFDQLEGKNSCHTGVDKTVGWKIPVGYLLRTAEMNFTDNQYKSASDFFSKSCVPGIRGNFDVSQAVKDDLCSLCNSTCGNDDDYYDYEGAFKCMAEGNDDRVGFVKQSTADNVFMKYGSRFGAAGDYRLLCTNGSKAELTEYKSCNIGHRPASAIVTNKDKSDEMIRMYADMLKNGDIAKLRTAGITTNSNSEPPESLHEFSDSAMDYVAGYRENVKALTRDGASTIAVSFALQIASILAFFFIF